MTARHLGILTLFLPILGTIVGCLASDEPPMSGMLTSESEIEQQREVSRGEETWCGSNRLPSREDLPRQSRPG